MDRWLQFISFTPVRKQHRGTRKRQEEQILMAWNRRWAIQIFSNDTHNLQLFWITSIITQERVLSISRPSHAVLCWGTKEVMVHVHLETLHALWRWIIVIIKEINNTARCGLDLSLRRGEEIRNARIRDYSCDLNCDLQGFLMWTGSLSSHLQLHFGFTMQIPGTRCYSNGIALSSLPLFIPLT